MVAVDLYDLRRTFGGDAEPTRWADDDAVEQRLHGIASMCATDYSMLMKPSDFGSVGSAVLPTVIVMPAVVMVATSGTPLAGTVPSPMSSVHVPLTVTVPPLMVHVVIHPVR